jgi:translation initiation factor IF-3
MINEEITDKEIRVIDSDGSQLGIMLSKDALQIAMDRDLDLVKIAPQAVPPVCKIMDYGKYRFELSKKEKEAKKNQKITEIKEIRLSLMIDVHDFNTKVNHAIRFIKDGDKVKVAVRFRGREMQHTSAGITLLDRFAEACSEVAAVEKKPKLEGRSMVMFIAAK